MQMSVTLLITYACVNFLAVHGTKHLKFSVQKFQSYSVLRTEGYLSVNSSELSFDLVNVKPGTNHSTNPTNPNGNSKR